MKTETLTACLIEAVRQKVPHDANLANVLMDTLYIGKEAAYRRLRGEVPFSFSEASMLSNALGISLDNISCGRSSNNALFGLNIIQYSDPYDTYYSSINSSVTLLRSLNKDDRAEWFEVSNVLPHRFYFCFDNLSRFFLYKWVYQHDRVNDVHYYSDLVTEDKHRKARHEFVEMSKEIPVTNYIWDSMIFRSLINDIKYFVSINLVKPNEVKIIKKELFELIDILEELAIDGINDKGNEVRIYISNINFEASYGYFETKTLKVSTIKVYSINTIFTTDPQVFDNHKSWMQSLRKYSTLISVSGEMQRINFFDLQRSYLKTL